MKRPTALIASLTALSLAAGPLGTRTAIVHAQAGALSPAYLDQLLAPVALYPDQLLAQILLSAGNKVVMSLVLRA